MLIVCDLWKNEVSWDSCALPDVMAYGCKHVFKRPSNERVDSMTGRRDRRRYPWLDFDFRDRRNFLCWLLGNWIEIFSSRNIPSDFIDAPLILIIQQKNTQHKHHHKKI